MEVVVTIIKIEEAVRGVGGKKKAQSPKPASPAQKRLKTLQQQASKKRGGHKGQDHEEEDPEDTLLSCQLSCPKKRCVKSPHL